MSLCDHLGSDEEIRLPLRELAENLVVTFLPARRIVVHSENPRGGKELFELPDDPLGARSDIAEMDASAFGTGGRHAVFRAAVVAFEAVFLAVIGEGHITVFAFCDIAAVAAEDGLGISPPVEEEDRLIPLREAEGKFFAQ